MRIGEIFKRTTNGSHSHQSLIILHNYKKNCRVVYIIEYGVLTGAAAILYANRTGLVASNDVVEKYSRKVRIWKTDVENWGCSSENQS